MDAGKLKEPVRVLALVEAEDGWRWEPVRETWARVEEKTGRNLFSTVGLGAKSLGLTLRRQELTLHNAILWRGKHCFLTDIREDGRLYLDVDAALVEVEGCLGVRMERRPDPGRGNRPGEVEVWRKGFPGVLTEKYVGYQREESHAEDTLTLVLVTPKPVELAAGDLVTVRGGAYHVTACHLLDPWKNEFELTRTKDV